MAPQRHGTPGRIRLLKADGTLHPDPVGGVPDVYAQRQGGLMDVILHPEYEERVDLFVVFARDLAREPHAYRTGEGDQPRLTDFEILFTTEPAKSGGFHSVAGWCSCPMERCCSAWARARPGPCRTWACTGARCSGSWTTDRRRRTTRSRRGSMRNRRSTHYGHRNPQGLTINPETGTVYVTEHGHRAVTGERRQAGRELRVAARDVRLRISRTASPTSLPGMKDPLVVWTPSIAASGLTFYGRQVPGGGDLFAGGLVLRQVRRVIMDGDEVVGHEHAVQRADPRCASGAGRVLVRADGRAGWEGDPDRAGE